MERRERREGGCEKTGVVTEEDEVKGEGQKRVDG